MKLFDGILVKARAKYRSLWFLDPD